MASSGKMEHPLCGTSNLFEPALMGLVTAVMNGRSLDTEDLNALTKFELAEWTGLPLTQAKEIAPAMTQDVPSDLAPLIDSHFRTLSQTARVLRERGFKSLGHFLFSTSRSGHGGSADAEQPRSSEEVVGRIVDAFPHLVDDAGLTPLAFLRRAQGMAHATHLAVAGSCTLADEDGLTADAGPMQILALRSLGVIKVSGVLATQLEAGTPLQSGSEHVQPPHRHANDTWSYVYAV